MILACSLMQIRFVFLDFEQIYQVYYLAVLRKYGDSLMDMRNL